MIFPWPPMLTSTRARAGSWFPVLSVHPHPAPRYKAQRPTSGAVTPDPAFCLAQPSLPGLTPVWRHLSHKVGGTATMFTDTPEKGFSTRGDLSPQSFLFFGFLSDVWRYFLWSQLRGAAGLWLSGGRGRC